MGELVRKKGRRGIDSKTKERVVELYQADELTVPEIARACKVSESSVFRIMRERRVGANGEEKERSPSRGNG